MAYRKTTTVQQPIPLRYRCSQCDSEALAILLAEGESSTIIQSRITDEYDYRTQNMLHRKAFTALKRRIRRIYKKEPQHWFRNIKCQCPNCNHVEPWGNDPDKKTINLFPLILPLSFAAYVITMLLKLDFLFAPILKLCQVLHLSTSARLILSFIGPWLIELAIIAGVIFLWNALSPKNRKRRAAMKSFPTENLPQYEKTEKEILDMVDNSLKSRIVDEGDGLSLKDFADFSGQSNQWNR